MSSAAKGGMGMSVRISSGLQANPASFRKGPRKGPFPGRPNRSAPFRPQMSQQEMSIKFAKELLAQGQHIQHKAALENLCTALAGSGRITINPHYTPSPLSSASLLGTFFKNNIVRNQDGLPSATMRKILAFSDPKHSVWTHSTSQLARKVQMEQVLDRLKMEIGSVELRLECNPEDPELRNKLQELHIAAQKIKTLLDNLELQVTGNLHPDFLTSTDKITMTPSEIASLPSPSGTMRGVLIRMRGPKKGSKAFKQEKSYGRVSINSVGYVNFDECNIQIPSKLGIHGLYIRFVYAKRDRLVSPFAKLPVLGHPEFSFRRFISKEK